ncbi:MAG TPA: tyrosine-type recombinase/integrase [bacterium]|nr:MAG: Tyrosine recombinase XerD [Candidatus Hydrogenedentes bacterium ADurb.Bin179]HPO07954.1 tyrosine-type recombinase/integrase [bacterium]
MKWAAWIQQYIEVHCLARGLSPKTMKAYQETLEGFQKYVQFRLEDRNPDELTAKDVLGYVDHLRRERHNGASAVNRQVTILRNFYRAMVAMDYLDARSNPLANFPKIKAAAKKLPVFLNEEEVQKLLATPRIDTVMGLRDRALLTLLYATGIRATECAGMTESDVNLEDQTIRVMGKGGNERSIPLNDEVVRVLKQYRLARGILPRQEGFFRSRSGRGMSRYALFERVRKFGRLARIPKVLSPHRMRHTFATHLVKAGVNLVTIRDLLGHRCITSTQIYLHTTAEDLRHAVNRHPVERLINRIEDLLPCGKVPFQWAPGERRVGSG